MTAQRSVQAYENFDLLIGSRTADGYPVTVTRAPAGDARGICHLDPAYPAVQVALRRFENGDSDAACLIDFGRHLFDHLFADDIASLYRGSLGHVRGKGKGLRIRLSLEPPELAALPWEYLYDPREDCFLAISPETPLVRYVPMARPTRPTSVAPPLRVLVVISAPSDAIPLDVTHEKGIIEDALRE